MEINNPVYRKILKSEYNEEMYQMLIQVMQSDEDYISDIEFANLLYQLIYKLSTDAYYLGFLIAEILGDEMDLKLSGPIILWTALSSPTRYAREASSMALYYAYRRSLNPIYWECLNRLSGKDRSKLVRDNAKFYIVRYKQSYTDWPGHQ